MKKSKVYTIKTAGGLDGETIIAYTHAAALKAARKYAGTQRGGIQTTVHISRACAYASDLDLAYLDARQW